MAKSTSKTLNLRSLGSEHTVRLFELLDKALSSVDLIATYNHQLLQFKITGEREDVSAAIRLIRSFYTSLKTSMFPDKNGMYIHDLALLQYLLRLNFHHENLIKLLTYRGFFVQKENQVFVSSAPLSEVQKAARDLALASKNLPPSVKKPLVRKVFSLLSSLVGEEITPSELVDLAHDLHLIRYRNAMIELTCSPDTLITNVLSLLGTENDDKDKLLNSIQKRRESTEEALELLLGQQVPAMTTLGNIASMGEKIKEWREHDFKEDLNP